MSLIRLPKDYKEKVFRSRHNLSLVKRTTFHVGTLIPIYQRHYMAGDRVRIDLNSIVQSQPLRTQLLGTFKYSLFIFWDSDSNYYGWMDNNTRQSTQDLLQKSKHRMSLSRIFGKLPSTSSREDFYNWRKDTSGACQRGSLADYFGVPPGFMNWESQMPDTVQELEHEIDITPWLTYLNIFRNYFANDQEEFFPFLYTKQLNAATNKLEPVWNWAQMIM